MISLEGAIQVIEESLVLESPRLIRTSSYPGSSTGETIDLGKDSSVKLLSRFIYNQFHTREKEVLASTSKVDIIRYLRDHFESIQSSQSKSKSIVQLASVNRSPGFVHIFGDKKWLQVTDSIGRFYLTAQNAIQRTEQFAKLVDSFNEKGLVFQAKVSWNPSIIRTDDSVFYFALRKDFEEARKSFELLPVHKSSNEEVLSPSLFTTPLTPIVSTAIERPNLKNENLSFGLERATVCAKYIIAKHKQSTHNVFSDLIDEWRYVPSF